MNFFQKVKIPPTEGEKRERLPLARPRAFRAGAGEKKRTGEKECAGAGRPAPIYGGGWRRQATGGGIPKSRHVERSEAESKHLYLIF